MENTQANKAHSVDAPIAFLFHIVHHWRRATDAQRSSGTRSRAQKVLYKAGMNIQDQANAVSRAAQAATWSSAAYGVGTVSSGRWVAVGWLDATVRGNGCSATLGSCLKNQAVDLANVPANRHRTPKVVLTPTLQAVPLAGTFAGHRFRYAKVSTRT